MTWKNRLREAAFTAREGERIVFLFENVSQSFSKKGTTFEFADANETFVQDLGYTDRRLPMRCIFSGANYDKDCEEFEDALRVGGVGVLEHPIYGRVNVVPLGEIRRADNLKTAGNQGIIEVTFYQSEGISFPAAQVDPVSAINSQLEDYNVGITGEYARELEESPLADQLDSKDFYETIVSGTKAGLKTVAAATNTVERQFNAISRSIDNNLNLFIEQPLTLATQAVLLAQAPARSAALLGDKLDAYKNLADSLVQLADDTVNLYADMLGFKTANLSASTSVSGSVLSVINNRYKTRAEAVNAAVAVEAEFNKVKEWRDDNYQNLNGQTLNLASETDTGDSYQPLQQIVAASLGYLIQLSFSLPTERRIVLTRESALHELVAQYYGTLDDRFDFFIDTNNLSGSEMINLPAGREIVIFE